MSTISGFSQSYGIIAPETISGYQQTLNKLASYAGTTPPPTQISLSTQAQQVSGFGSKLATIATSNSSFEDSRGLSGTTQLQADFVAAYKTASSRLTIAGLNANTQQSAGSNVATIAGSASSIADIVSAYTDTPNNKKEYDVFGNEVGGNAVFTAIGNALKKQNARTNAALHLQGVYNPNKKADPYGRKEPTKYSANGSTKIDVQTSALTSTAVDIPVAAGLLPGNKYTIVTTTTSGPQTSSNQGVAASIKTSNQDTTLAVDTRDPIGDDTRTTNVDLTLGDGSNVVFVAGTNDTTIHAGSGHNFIVAEGNSTIYGGSGDSILSGKNVIGGTGNDTIFSSGFAYGGDGNDFITLFSPSTTVDPTAPLPFAVGGNGNDTILADVKANVIGGPGNDNIILRAGGSVSSGDGNNTVSAEDVADVTLGNGKNDVHLVKGGSVVVGNGANTITSRAFGDVTIGTGKNTIELRQGGTVGYRAGGNVNSLIIGPPDISNKTPKTNVITLSGLLYADTNTTATGLSASIKEKTGKLGGFDVSLTDATTSYKLHFSKSGQAQDVTILNGVITVGSVYTGS